MLINETTYERVCSMVESQQLNAIYVDFMLNMCIDQEMIEENTVEAVIGSGGDHVGALKGNQQTFFEEVKDY